MRRLLVLEDNVDFVRALRRSLGGRFDLIHVSSVAEAQAAMERAVSAAVVDLFLSTEGTGRPEGLDFIEWLSQAWPGVPSVAVTGYDRAGLERRALRLGASDFVAKGSSLNPAEVETRIEAAIERKRLDRTMQVSAPDPPVLEGESRAIQELRRALRTASQYSPVRVLLHGETGTRKDLVARGFAQLGHGREGPFVAVECAGIDADATGVALEGAGGGVLFLEEIGYLPLESQRRLLSSLEEQLQGAPGTATDVPAQVVSSTSWDLQVAIDRSELLPEIRALLGALEIHVPSLRDRREDIQRLATAFLESRRDARGSHAIRLSEEALIALERYSWPGNIRELWGVMEAAVSRAQASGSKVILPEHFSESIPNGVPTGFAAPSSRGAIFERLAWHELNEVSRALRRTQGRKEQARELLGYPSRHTMRRRLDAIRERFPHVWAAFPDLVRSYEERNDKD